MMDRDKTKKLYQLTLKSMRIVCLLVTLLSILALNSVTWADESKVKIGVLAKRGAEQCIEQWGPTADYLTAHIPGYSFEVVPLDFEEILPAVERGEVDFVLANSSFYVELEVKYGTSRLVTLENLRGDEGYTIFGGVIFGRADRDDIQELNDLRGKSFMAVEETSLGGWHMAWRELRERGIDPYRDFTELQFGGTHDAVVYAVRDGTVDAGTVRTDTLERMAEEGKIDVRTFRILNQQQAPDFPFALSTQLYPEWPLAKVKHTPDELATEVAIALLQMSADNPAAKAAKCTGWTTPLSYQPVHECLKALRLSPYEKFGQVTLGDTIKQYWYWIVIAIVFLIFMAIITSYMLRLNRQLDQSRSDLEKELSEREMAESERERLLTTLEHRSTQLQAAAQVARDATAIRDVDQLLDQTARLISERFDFYHAGIFLLDEAQEYAVLRAASSEGGQRMLAREHKLKVGETGIVGHVTGSGEPRIALDVGEDAAFFDNPDLPDTRSEMALPLKVQERVIGALDVQSTEPEAFGEDDVAVLQVMADQLAIAIENARLLYATQQTVQELSSSVAEILAVTTQQAAGAGEQSAALAQTTTTVDEVKLIAEQAVARAQEVANTSQRSVEISRNGRQAVQNTINGMGRIKERVTSIAENILTLSEQTQQIGDIIASVNDLAAQSNMLALNAAVEAARAGEHGKGFAVVAAEVRSLAEQSRQATAQIKAILQDIQQATNSTVIATEEGTKGVDEGVLLVAQTHEVIEQLAGVIDASAQIATQMVAGGRQQATGVEQIALAMRNINQATAQSLASTHQAEQTAQDLNALARSLSEIVEQYQV